jgi:hypothetical protein
MRRFFLISVVVVVVSILVSADILAQTAKFDPKDFSGVWGRFGSREGRGNRQGGNPFPEAGDDGFGTNVPPFTPEGQKRFDNNKPGYGRILGSPDANAHPEEHIGRRRSVAPRLQNDPASQCSPNGLTRLILSSYFASIEFVHARDRIIQNFEWTNDYRIIWMDGRKLPEEVDIPRWNGYSVGRWEGDTLVVNSYGFEESSWLDHFGYPHSAEMRLEERYRKIAPDRLELTMTLTDPQIYTKPFVGGRKVFRLLPREEASLSDWYGMQEERCVPAEEFDFNDRVRAG